MFYDALNEDEKQQIARLYHEKKLSIDEICKELGVCKKTAYNYIDYGYEHVEKNVESVPENTSIKTLSPKKRQYLCKNCGHITDYKSKTVCPNCWRGPADSFLVEIGSPEYERHIEENKKKQQEEETIHWNRDYYFCKDCDYCSNQEFKICPKCRSRAVEFAPNGVEPRNPSKYTDPEPQDNEDHDPQDHEPGDDNETNTKAVEEQTQEYEYECPKCHKEFNGVLENCPHCGTQLEESWECPKCHHRWYGSPDHCPKCGYSPGLF